MFKKLIKKLIKKIIKNNKKFLLFVEEWWKEFEKLELRGAPTNEYSTATVARHGKPRGNEQTKIDTGINEKKTYDYKPII